MNLTNLDVMITMLWYDSQWLCKDVSYCWHRGIRRFVILYAHMFMLVLSILGSHCKSWIHRVNIQISSLYSLYCIFRLYKSLYGWHLLIVLEKKYRRPQGYPIKQFFPFHAFTHWEKIRSFREVGSIFQILINTGETGGQINKMRPPPCLFGRREHMYTVYYHESLWYSTWNFF